MEDEDLKKVLDSGVGIPLKNFLKRKLDELKSIENVKDVEGIEEQALEIKAQKRAHKKLLEIFNEVITLEQKTKPKDPRDDFGITDELLDNLEDKKHA